VLFLRHSKNVTAKTPVRLDEVSLQPVKIVGTCLEAVVSCSNTKEVPGKKIDYSSLLVDDHTFFCFQFFQQEGVDGEDPALHEGQATHVRHVFGQFIGIEGDWVTSLDAFGHDGHLFWKMRVQYDDFGRSGVRLGVHDGVG
jgi:hypothetical protein